MASKIYKIHQMLNSARSTGGIRGGIKVLTKLTRFVGCPLFFRAGFGVEVAVPLYEEYDQTQFHVTVNVSPSLKWAGLMTIKSEG